MMMMICRLLLPDTRSECQVKVNVIVVTFVLVAVVTAVADVLVYSYYTRAFTFNLNRRSLLLAVSHLNHLLSLSSTKIALSDSLLILSEKF